MRKLAICSTAFSAAIFLASYAIPAEWLYIGLLISLCAAVGSLAFPGKSGARTGFAIAALGAAFGFVWYGGYDRLIIQPAEALTGLEARVTCRAEGFTVSSGSVSSIELTLMEDGLPKCRFSLSSYGEPLPEFEPGDIIEADVRFVSAARSRGQDIWYYTSKGIFQRAYLRGDIEKTGRWALSFLNFPQYIARTLKNEVLRVYPEDVSHLMVALLTGDKALLQADLELDNAISRSGMQHIVAVSGMHLAFIVGFIQLLIKGKRRSALVNIALILVFIPMAGGGPSVVRAGVMQLLLIIAPLFGRETDSLTSLSAVLALLLLSNPEAARNVGLQLSFTAMAGIMLVAPRLNDWIIAVAGVDGSGGRGIKSKVLRFLSSGFSSTIGATVFSVPLAALYFGYVSLVAPLTNILTLSLFSFTIVAGYAVCLLGLAAAPAGAFLAGLLAWPLRYVIWVIRLLSKPFYAAVYTSNSYFAGWLVLTYIVFGITYIFRDKKERYRPFIPAGISVMLLCAAILLSSGPNTGGMVTVLDAGQGQCVAVMSGSATVVIDCGGNSGVGKKLYEYLYATSRNRLDILILTHLHSDHANDAALLLARMEVKQLMMPPDDEDPDGILPGLLSIAAQRGTEVIYITEDSYVEIGEITLWLYAPIGRADVNERGIVICGELGGFSFVVTGDIDMTTERRLVFRNEMPDVDLLVAGHHGSRYSTSEELLSAVKPEYAVISSGYNSYGHPTGDALRRIAGFGCEIYRTDLSGNIEFIIR